MAGSFTGGGGTVVNAGNGQVASAQTGQIIQPVYTTPQWSRRNRNKGGRGQQPQLPTPPAGLFGTPTTPYMAQPQQPRAPAGLFGEPTTPYLASPSNNYGAWVNKPPTMPFLASPAWKNKPTRLVRTGEGTSQEISNPTNQPLPTGTVFSGGSPLVTEGLPQYPAGTFFAADGTLVRGPGLQPTEAAPAYSPFASYYKGWSNGGGGGGGYARTPSWLQNLYSWNFG